MLCFPTERLNTGRFAETKLLYFPNSSNTLFHTSLVTTLSNGNTIFDFSAAVPTLSTIYALQYPKNSMGLSTVISFRLSLQDGLIPFGHAVCSNSQHIPFIAMFHHEAFVLGLTPARTSFFLKIKFISKYLTGDRHSGAFHSMRYLPPCVEFFPLTVGRK